MLKEFQWGLGLRSNHFEEWHKECHVPVIEIMTDNLIYHEGGPALWHTCRIAERASFTVLHGVGLNIGGKDPLSPMYFEGLRNLVDRFRPKVVSDHLCFTQFNTHQSYELLPLERTEFTLNHVAERIDRVQQHLGRQFALENASAYIEYKNDRIPEPEFMNRIAEKTGCGILLDINNIYVNAHNFNQNPLEVASQYCSSDVVQIHIAGHSRKADFLFDTHDTPVCDPVWQLLSQVLLSLSRCDNTKVPVILENDCPNTSLECLLNELTFGRQLTGEYTPHLSSPRLTR